MVHIPYSGGAICAQREIAFFLQISEVRLKTGNVQPRESEMKREREQLK